MKANLSGTNAKRNQHRLINCQRPIKDKPDQLLTILPHRIVKRIYSKIFADLITNLYVKFKCAHFVCLYI